ncbi:Paraplegin [Stylophora pistillata]|uniref:Paraplegin n=1 Tax=Stylophora pistillata TaxID=50429 RepID=A0A2B4S3T6_STYPI|nr:Paraplegin [Stylophora pistillata]
MAKEIKINKVEHQEVPSSQDKVYVFLHRGAVVGGKEVLTHGPHFVFSIASLDSFEKKMASAQADLHIASHDFVPVRYSTTNELLFTALSAALSIAVLGLVWYWLFGRGTKGGNKSGGIMGMNPFANYIKAKPTVVMPGSGKGISFKDVAGMEDAKCEVMEFVDYLKLPARYSELGAKIPKGALLVGPPGTGKTLLAKAVATEADVPFLTMAGSDFVEVFGGVGSARVRDLFGRARKLAPCILYIDEVDAIGRSRSSNSMGGHSEQESTLNQLLVEMDGMNTMEGVVMLASTNRHDILDQALLRPGRFDRLIAIDLPTLIERQAIFEVHLKKLSLKMPVKAFSKTLAELTPGNSGADIANICNEAALHAARMKDKTVDKRNFEYAVERVIAGMEKKTQTMSPEERRIVAFHEAGHALVGWMLEHTDPLLKLFDRMCMALGGRAAEAKIFRRVTTGAEDDLRKVTDMAYKQVVTFGMNPRVGNISFPVRKPSEPTKKFYSDKLAKLMDEEVRILVGKAFQTTNSIIEENRDKLYALAHELLDKEVLSYDDVAAVLGPCPHGDKRVRSNSHDGKSKSEPLFST